MDIKVQFSFFLAAFIAKMILNVLYLFRQHLFLENERICIFYAMQGVSHIVVDIMPIMVMLYIHHKNYRADKRQAVRE